MLYVLFLAVFGLGAVGRGPHRHPQPRGPEAEEDALSTHSGRPGYPGPRLGCPRLGLGKGSVRARLGLGGLG